MKVNEKAKITEEEIKEVEEMDTEEITVQKIIDKFKKQYKRIYETDVAGERIIWRPIKRSEYREIMAYEDKELSDREMVYVREEMMAKKVILYPKTEDIIEEFAGVAEVIADECMYYSGFMPNGIKPTKQL
jgi:molybdopterin converting factor small subunit